MPILHRFVPALGFRALTPLYDRFIALTLKEATLKRRLVEQARIEPEMRVLDLGCGTGTLALLVKQMHPDAHVIGLDVDPEVLAIARRKADQAGIAIEWIHARAEDANIPAGTLDRVLSTLMLHHLAPDEKQHALEAARRWLKPKGELHVRSFGAPQDTMMWLASSSCAPPTAPTACAISWRPPPTHPRSRLRRSAADASRERPSARSSSCAPSDVAPRPGCVCRCGSRRVASPRVATSAGCAASRPSSRALAGAASAGRPSPRRTPCLPR